MTRWAIIGALIWLVAATARAQSVTHVPRTPLHIVERFKPMSSGDLEWSATIDDVSGWIRPWTFSTPLARMDDRLGPLENACHEGNYTLRNILSGARAEEIGQRKAR